MDRKKDMINMSGWKIYPTEVENVIIQHPAVADVAVFGVPDERKGEVPMAAVVLIRVFPSQDRSLNPIVGSILPASRFHVS
jgi:acyl-CoA synthetase (AMP-forming)/AMP-acid ligase II